MTRFLRHFRYVMGENPVTVIAFSLFMLIVFLALFGPWLAPYNPLSTDAALNLKPPSWAHPFGTDHLGRDVFSRVIVADPARHGDRAVRRSPLLRPRQRARLFRGILGRLDRPHRRAAHRYHHGLSAVRPGDGHRRRDGQYGGEHHLRHGDHQPALLCARRAGGGRHSPQRGLCQRGAALRQLRRAHPGDARSFPTSCRR